MKQKGVTIWFTGLSGAGKTTIAKRVFEILKDKGIDCERLDGDTLREGICKDLGFSQEDRNKNIERVTYIAKVLTKHNVITLASLISPYKSMREYARNEIGAFLEIFVDASLEVVQKRDVKGLYKKALAGEIKGFTGIDAPYEKPENPDLTICTASMTVDESANQVITLLESKGYI
ncbi:adenylylsulfate kinase [Clostridium sp. DSM 8431]|uniref:adenylyl-sulfate kinase n=1 Tax=Clostridium sp. DSM 8431 TaxID=1761781 RepID=UPI0008F3DDC7|nr:adenylyl-sulfate kinase [Clostridium sp. DSM 8431]SFU32440.1 adenylylsulfate kinase [Clostridium sp. DSM 8431]